MSQSPQPPQLPSQPTVRPQPPAPEQAEEPTALVRYPEASWGRRLLRVGVISAVAVGVVGGVSAGVMYWRKAEGTGASGERGENPAAAPAVVAVAEMARAGAKMPPASQEPGRPALDAAAFPASIMDGGNAVAPGDAATTSAELDKPEQPGDPLLVEADPSTSIEERKDTDSAKSMCLVSVTSKPRKAVVSLEEKRLGVTPFQTKLPCGKAVLTFERERYQTLERRVTLGEGKLSSVIVEMQRPPVLLKISSTPTGARVVIDGKVVGTTPMEHSIPGHVRTLLEVRKSGYRRFTKRLNPQPPEASIDVRLRRRR